ncbi:hypothetical protein C1645_754464, partial [Glomus cerebriforme]
TLVVSSLSVPSPVPSPSLPLPLLSPSASSLEKRQRDLTIIDAPAKKQCITSEVRCFCLDIDVPLWANGSVNTLEVIKPTVCTFDQKTIALGSIRSYKCLNYLQIKTKCNEYVLRESVYDAEMYRILHNWFTKVHGFKITGQWHLEGIGNDGDWHHLFCDLMIKKPDNPYSEAILELIVTGSVSKIEKHFDRVIKYANQLCLKEV